MTTSSPISMTSCLRKAPSQGNGVVVRNPDRSAEASSQITAAHQRNGASTAGFGNGGQRHPALTISLQDKQMIGLEDSNGVEIHLMSGQLWITQADDYRDIILQHGDRFQLDRGGLALVTATQPSILCIAPADANILNRLRFE